MFTKSVMHPDISSSVVPFSSCPQSLPASGSFPMSQLFASGGQSTEVSASSSVLPMNIPADSYACKRLKSIGSKAVSLDQQNLYHQGSCCSVSQWCPTLCDPINCSTPGLPVHHQLPECTQTHVRCVSDAIQSFCPLSSPSPPAFNLSQHQGLFQRVSSLHQMIKVLELQPKHQSLQGKLLEMQIFGLSQDLKSEIVSHSVFSDSL